VISVNLGSGDDGWYGLMTSLRRVDDVDRSPLLLLPASIAKLSGDFRGRRANVGDERWFFHGGDEWAAIAERLKLTLCPNCKAIGTLIRHGFPQGFEDTRAQRVETVLVRSAAVVRGHDGAAKRINGCCFFRHCRPRPSSVRDGAWH